MSLYRPSVPLYEALDGLLAQWAVLSEPASQPFGFWFSSAANGAGLRRNAAFRFMNNGAGVGGEPNYGYTFEDYYLDTPNTQTEFHFDYQTVGATHTVRPYSWNAKRFTFYVENTWQVHFNQWQDPNNSPVMELWNDLSNPRELRLYSTKFVEATNNVGFIFQYNSAGVVSELMRLTNTDQLLLAGGTGGVGQFLVRIPNALSINGIAALGRIDADNTGDAYQTAGYFHGGTRSLETNGASYFHFGNTTVETTGGNVPMLRLTNSGLASAWGIGHFQDDSLAGWHLNGGWGQKFAFSPVGALVLLGGLGCFNHAAPAAQPAAPVTLGDVIAILQGIGACA